MTPEYIPVCITHMCLCAADRACVYRCVQSARLILRSSPIHPLILLTYSPNPVIPRSFFHPAFYPFISPSCYLSLAPFSVPASPIQAYFFFYFPPSPLPPITYPALPPSLLPSGPSSRQTQQMSESLASGLFFRRVQSLPDENAVRGRNCTLISAN